MIIECNYGAVVYYSDLVRAHYAGDTLRYHDNGGALQLLAERLLELRVSCKVQRRHTVVKYQYLGILYNRTGDGKALLLSAGKGASLFRDHVLIAVRESADELVRLGYLRGTLHLFVGGVRVAPADILLDGFREQLALL